MIQIREACDADVEQVRSIFLDCYGKDYAYPQYYDIAQLKKMVHSDDTLLLVAEDSGELLGTASVLLEVGAHADLVGEFGRLAVRPAARRQGVGRMLMQRRLDLVQQQLHAGLVENRVVHSFSQSISLRQGFRPVGFLPLKLLTGRRESVALFTRHFGDALALRRNNPHLIPEAHHLASLALENCHLPSDVITDDHCTPYVHRSLQCRELTVQDYVSLLRIERGRVGHRTIFGPMRLHYGLFKLEARHARYLLAFDGSELIGAVGVVLDEVEKAARLLELISVDDTPVRFLLSQVIEQCTAWGIEYLEADVSAFAPSMQRTLLELAFQPAAYIPAMVFHDVERLDVLRMVRLFVPAELAEVDIVPPAQPIVEAVRRRFTNQPVPAVVAELFPKVGLFNELNREQIAHIASLCEFSEFAKDEDILAPDCASDRIHFILDGRVSVRRGSTGDQMVLTDGQCLGEVLLLGGAADSATARAMTSVHAAALSRIALNDLSRVRPDIGVILYRNLARYVAQQVN